MSAAVIRIYSIVKVDAGRRLLAASRPISNRRTGTRYPVRTTDRAIARSAHAAPSSDPHGIYARIFASGSQ